MLSDEVIEKVVERLVRRIEIGNEYVLKKIGESVKKIGTLTPSKAQELVQILKYGGDYDKITKKLAEITKLNVKDIKKIFEEVAKNDYNFAKQFYKYRNKKYIPFDENVALRRQVDALANLTAKEYMNFARSEMLGLGIKDKNGNIEFKGLKKAYNELLDEAVLNVGQGKETFDSAMYRQLKQIGTGLKVIYKDGRAVRLDSVVRMHLKNALRELHNETQEMFGNEFDADGVEISVHLNPAPDHELVQGRQFSKEQFNKFQNDEDAVSYDGIDFPAEFEGHDRRSISQYNCYHYTFAIVLGVNKPQYSNEELQQIIKDNEKGFDFDGKHYTMYEGTQLQRKIETEIRKAKDSQILGRASGNENLIRESQERITQLTTKYKELSEVSKLPTKANRMRVSGYHRVKTNYIPKDKNIDISDRLSKYNITVSEDLFNKDIDKELVNRSLNQVENLVNKYPVLKEKIKKDGLNIGTDYFYFAGETSETGTEITLSEGLFKNKKGLLSTIKEGQDDNWSIKVYKENYDIYTITHEMGHILEDAIMGEKVKIKNNIDLSNLINKEEFGRWKLGKYKQQEDEFIFNDIFEAIDEKENMGVWKLRDKYISDYGKSTIYYEWFAELFTKLELGEEDNATKELKKYLEGELWKK